MADIKPEDYWRLVAAPKLKARKQEIGRSRTNTEIAAAVELASGKPTTRQALEHFINGVREPYISQLVAICRAMEIALEEVMQPPTVQRPPLVRRKIHPVKGEENHQIRKNR